MSRQPIVIIGSGLAGYTVAREFRKLDTETSIQIISADHGGFYSKPMLSNALATGKTPLSILNANAEKMAEQLKMTIRSHSRVTAFDPASKNVTLQGGEKLPYSQLILALGADPIRLPLEGDGVDAILSVNDLDDYHQLCITLKGKKDVTILGAGLIGCEFANDLAVAGYRVRVIDISARPLGRLLPQAGGAFLQQRLEAVGIVFHMGAATQRVERIQESLRLTLDNGEVIQTDVLLSAIGLRPRTALAEAAGIKVNRGITVSRSLQTRYSDIYALGDCAEVDGRVLPFVMPIMHAARGLAATLARTPTLVRYPAMPVVVKTPACATVVSPPDPHAQGEWLIEESENGVKALFQSAQGKLLGYALLGMATREKNLLAAQLPAVME
ncbi:NAD(P)/FAD-dependent oxidoreductase [Nitrosospira sp. NpAV]|uniref:NAD(P)/FAD-dependent oxidoreductase n=1 Tax=Nitrosospira sp. NpAV TaxID=58133 RepID=UPI0005A1AE6B|nr:FAD-dependent oxidoreductase [Nitrosospira sp. NpAV]KIO49637.1 pyridine nucleotide-disulfide oxidoreductase [Nitrosospira sp. NpAV]